MEEAFMGNPAQHRVIDFHSHLVPPHLAASRPRYMSDIEILYQDQKDAGVDASVLSTPMFLPKGDAPTLEAVKGFNQYASELARRSEGRIVPLAFAYPWGGKEYLDEVARAIKEGICKGVLVNTNGQGEYLDSEKVDPLYALATEWDFPIFVHPPYAGMTGGDMRQFKLHEMVGRPCDTTLTLARLICAGVLERYPALKLVGAHVGGAILMLPGRLDFCYEWRHETYFGPWDPDVLSHPPSYYINQLYVDTMGFHPPAVMLAVNTLGADRVLLGSDHPPVNTALRKTLDTTMNLPISAADKQKILGDNAARLLKLH
jgi:aminocarboxymuconate-semialdehyde decarboxylase